MAEKRKKKDDALNRLKKAELAKRGLVIDSETGEIIEGKPKVNGSTASVAHHSSASTEDVRDIMESIMHWYDRPIIKTDEECAERLEEFFTHCADTGELPTIEKLALSLGTSAETVRKWQAGEGHSSPYRREMITRAKTIIAAMDAEMAARGKIPQVVYIFRSKNYYGMRDQQQIVVEPRSPLGDTNSDAADILNALPEGDE